MSGLRVERVADLTGLGAAVADRLIAVCRARQEAGAVPCIVLTGGRAGAEVLRAAGQHADRAAVDWARVRVLWGDERWVPAGDPERNDLLADESLFELVGMDPALVHRVAASDAGLTLDEAAASYARVVDGLERIDVALNGVGEDGHVASLFPGRDDLLRDDPATPAALAVRDSPKPPPERVTLSLPALRRADRVWLLAAGEGKAEAVRELLSAGAGSGARLGAVSPAARLNGRSETVLWADGAALGSARGIGEDGGER